MALRKGEILEDGTILCYGNGVRCITPAESELSSARTAYFLAPREGSPTYDAMLAELAGKLNDLVNEVRGNARSDARIGFLVTGRGFVPVWKRELNDYEDPDSIAPRDQRISLDDKSDAEISTLLHLD